MQAWETDRMGSLFNVQRLGKEMCPKGRGTDMDKHMLANAPAKPLETGSFTDFFEKNWGDAIQECNFHY